MKSVGRKQRSFLPLHKNSKFSASSFPTQSPHSRTPLHLLSQHGTTEWRACGHHLPCITHFWYCYSSHSYILSGHLTLHPVAYAETRVAAVPARHPDDAGRFISDASPPSWLFFFSSWRSFSILSIPPLIPAGIQEFRRIPAGIDRNLTETEREYVYLLPNNIMALNLLLIYAYQDPYTPPYVM